MIVIIDGKRYVPQETGNPAPGLTLGAALRKCREGGTTDTLDAAARAVGVSKTCLWELENDKTADPSFWLVARLAAYYGVSLGTLARCDRKDGAA